LHAAFGSLSGEADIEPEAIGLPQLTDRILSEKICGNRKKLHLP
jgi:hypothetical protein